METYPYIHICGYIYIYIYMFIYIIPGKILGCYVFFYHGCFWIVNVPRSADSDGSLNVPKVPSRSSQRS